MAHTANTRPNRDSQDLTDAFDVHAALASIEAKRPYLKQNPRWQMIRWDSYEAFHDLMGAE